MSDNQCIPGVLDSCVLDSSPPTNRYLRRFLDLKCAGDILNATAPINDAAKELTVAMAAIKHLKPFFLNAPMQRNLVDLCAGNALTSIIATHMLPVYMSIAVDKTPRYRPGHSNVQRWHYRQKDIFVDNNEESVSSYAVVAVHACGQLAVRIIELYHQWSNARLLVLLPCYRGSMKGHPVPSAFASRVSKYEAWAWHLAELAKGTLHIDADILSPCNAVIVAEKLSGRCDDDQARPLRRAPRLDTESLRAVSRRRYFYYVTRIPPTDIVAQPIGE